MAKSASPAAAAPPEAAASPAPAKRKRPKKLVLAVAGVLALGAAGGTAWYFLRPTETAEDAASATPAAEKRAPPLFHTLELFTVNLQDPDGDRYAQIGVVLELAGPETLDAVKAQMPVIRNGILLLLSSKEAGELATPRGKETLAHEIADVTRRPLPGKPVPAPKAAKNAKPPANAKVSGTQVQASAKGDDDVKASDGKAGAAKAGAAPADDRGVAAVYFSTFIIQ